MCTLGILFALCTILLHPYNNIDLNLITRGAGFGYLGSVITSINFASFTFIFFALESSIMAQGLLLGLGIPLWAGYLISTIMVIPFIE